MLRRQERSVRKHAWPALHFVEPQGLGDRRIKAYPLGVFLKILLPSFECKQKFHQRTFDPDHVTSGQQRLAELQQCAARHHDSGEMEEAVMSTVGNEDSDRDIAQKAVTHRYDRVARIYDLYDAPMELLGGRRRRERVLSKASGRVLEVGVGTGKNLGLYPSEVELTAIDVSENMLAKARRRAEKKGIEVDLDLVDVRHLPFDDDQFDTVATTCVFCSVADPVAGLREIARVLRPEGHLLMLEHVRPQNRLMGWFADRLSPIVSRLVGASINRRTEENVVGAGLEIMDIRRSGVWREIVARSDQDGPTATLLEGVRRRDDGQ